MLRGAPAILLLVLLLPVAPAGPRADASRFDRCLGASTIRSETRAACLRDLLAERPLAARDLSVLEPWAQTRPEVLLELLAVSGPAGGAGDGHLRAGLLDMQGRALEALGRHAEAARTFSAALELDDGTTRLSWFSEDGEPRWTRSLDAGDERLTRAARSLLAAGDATAARRQLERALALGAAADDVWARSGGGSLSGLPAPASLAGERWFKPLPAVEIPLVGGGVLQPREEVEPVLLLDFWATWCRPCAEELPHLQALHAALGEHGLASVAVNVGEPESVARPYAEDLGLTLPLGSSTPELERAFETDMLPVVVVTDRRRRIRGRWDGYEPGQEREIAKLVRTLLEEQAPPSERVGDVLRGSGALRIAWIRETPGAPEGLAVGPLRDGRAGIFAALDRSVAMYGADGRTLETWKAPSSTGRLRPDATPGSAEPALLSFRPGGRELIFFEIASGKARSSSAPSAVFDAAVTRAPTGEGRSALWLSTLDGLLRGGVVGGDPLVRVEGITSALAVEPLADDGRLVVLEPGGGLTRVDAQGLLLGRRRVEPDSFTLLAGKAAGSGFGVAPSGVVAAVTGRFVDSASPQAALATRTGQLVVVDVASGDEVFRARWPGIADLASGDLDGDGLDELIVGGARRIALVRGADSGARRTAERR